MHIVRPATKCAFLVNSYQFPQYVTSQRSVIIWIKDPMLIWNVLANLGESVPLIFERVSSIPKVLLKTRTSDLRVTFERRLNIRYLLVRNILFLQVIQDITMMLSIKAKEHLRVVQIAWIFDWLAHAVK